jgi:hypothetical protein
MKFEDGRRSVERQPPQEDMALRKDWVAKCPTALKASTAFSGDLPLDQKLAVRTGARLTARLTGEDKEYWLVAEARLDGQPVAEHLRFVYKGQWELEGANEHWEKPSPIQAALPARGRHNRRLYASFKRRQMLK